MALIDGLMEVIVYVEDMNRAVAFYRDALGLGVTFPTGLADYGQEFWVTLATGECTLALHGGGHRRQGQDSAKIVFRVKAVRATRERLLASRVQLGEVRNPAPGVWVVDGHDSEGNPLSLESRD